MSIDIWLIRHAQTGHNTRGVEHFLVDPPLNALGKQQAIALSEKIDTHFSLIVASPLIRCLETAKPLCDKQPSTPIEVWPIQEFTYMSPAQCVKITNEQRKAKIDAYWTHCDPFYCDGNDAESFADLITRLEVFHHQLYAQKSPVIVFGHALFLKAYLLWLDKLVFPTSVSMRMFRQRETQCPLLHTEVNIVHLA